MGHCRGGSRFATRVGPTPSTQRTISLAVHLHRLGLMPKQTFPLKEMIGGGPYKIGLHKTLVEALTRKIPPERGAVPTVRARLYLDCFDRLTMQEVCAPMQGETTGRAACTDRGPHAQTHRHRGHTHCFCAAQVALQCGKYTESKKERSSPIMIIGYGPVAVAVWGFANKHRLDDAAVTRMLRDSVVEGAGEDGWLVLHVRLVPPPEPAGVVAPARSGGSRHAVQAATRKPLSSFIYIE
jgi:hypothetical protein